MNVAMHIHDNAENITPVLDDSRPPSKPGDDLFASNR